MFGMLSVLAELQRELLVANTRDGPGPAATAPAARGPRMEQIDPSLLLVDRNVRRDAAPDKTLVDSVHDLGVLVLGRVESSAMPGPPGPSLVLAGSQVADDAVLDAGSAIGRGVSIGPGATVSGSVVFDDVVIEAGVQVRGSVVGRGARIGPAAVVDGAVIGDGARVGAHNELLGGVRVFPGHELAEGAVRFSGDRS